MTEKKVPGYIIVRVWHPTDDLEIFSSIISINKMYSWLAGSQRKTPTGRLLSGFNKESYWCSEQIMFFSDMGFNAKITSTIELLLPASQKLKELKATGGRIELYLQLPGSVNNGGTFESSIIKTLGELGVDLAVEVFPKTGKDGFLIA